MSSLGSESKSTPMAVPLSAPAPNFPGLTSDFLSLFGGVGTAGQGGGALAQGVNTLTGMAQTGMPTDPTAFINAWTGAQKTMHDQGFENIQESLAKSGMGMSSSTVNALGTFENQFQSNLMSQIQNFILASSEAAKGRQLQAASILEETGANFAGSMHPTTAIGTQSTTTESPFATIAQLAMSGAQLGLMASGGI